MSKYEAPADEFPKKGRSGSGTNHGYTVQARLAYHMPDHIGGMLLDTRWQEVHFAKAPIGVPGEAMPSILAEVGLLTYPQAQALRWWFHAEAAKAHKQHCLETRLVKHTLKYSHEVTAVSAHDLIGGDDRSHIMPDYGKKEAAE